MKYIGIALTIPYLIYLIGVSVAKAVDMPIVNPIVMISAVTGSKYIVNPQVTLIITLASTAFAGLTINTLFALGEEIGWRGLLQDELCSLIGFKVTPLVIGILWALWHAPLIIMYGYNYPHHRDAVGVVMFIIICSIWSCILSILKVRSESMIPPAVTHGTLNAIGGLMLYTIIVRDEIWGLPVGILGVVASTITLIIIYIIMLKR